MDINGLPNEILCAILEYTVKFVELDGVNFSYGLHHNLSTEPNPPRKFSRYLRGPLPPYQQRWDAVDTIRLVCQKWHDWALDYALREIYVKNWIGAEKWCDLTTYRGEIHQPSNSLSELTDDREVPVVRTHRKSQRQVAVTCESSQI